MKLSRLFFFFFSRGNKRECYLTVQFSCLTFQSGPLFLVTLYFQKSFVACQMECHPARFQNQLFFLIRLPLLKKHNVSFITDSFERSKQNGHACMCALKPPFFLNGLNPLPAIMVGDSFALAFYL